MVFTSYTSSVMRVNGPAEASASAISVASSGIEEQISHRGRRIAQILTGLLVFLMLMHFVIILLIYEFGTADKHDLEHKSVCKYPLNLTLNLTHYVANSTPEWSHSNGFNWYCIGCELFLLLAYLWTLLDLTIFNLTETRSRLSCGFILMVLTTVGYILGVFLLVANQLFMLQPFLITVLLAEGAVLSLFAIFAKMADAKVEAAKAGTDLGQDFQRALTQLRICLILALLLASGILISVYCMYDFPNYYELPHLAFTCVLPLVLLLWLLTAFQIGCRQEKSQTKSENSGSFFTLILFIIQFVVAFAVFVYLFFVRHPQMMAILLAHGLLVFEYIDYLGLIRHKWQLTKDGEKKSKYEWAMEQWRTKTEERRMASNSNGALFLIGQWDMYQMP